MTGFIFYIQNFFEHGKDLETRVIDKFLIKNIVATPVVGCVPLFQSVVIN